MSPDALAAIDAVNDFTRTKIRQDGFYRRIMPPFPLTDGPLPDTAAEDAALLAARRMPRWRWHLRRREAYTPDPMRPANPRKHLRKRGG